MKTNTKPPLDNTKQTILVIGANGKTGRRVVQRLRAAEYSVKAASRSSKTRFDWSDPTTWTPALEGTQAAYVTYYPDLAFPGASEKVEAFAKLAVSLNVKRLVLLSGRGEDGARDAEIRLENSGAEWTVVRCAVFNQNFSESFSEAIRYGRLSMPAGNTREPFVDAEDIADVVFKALTEEGHEGQIYELTGPRLLTLSEVAGKLAEAIGRNVRYCAVSVDEYAEELAEHGYSKEEAQPIAQLISDVLDGRNAYLTDGVKRALGRAPREFADYANEAATTGIWDLERAAS